MATYPSAVDRNRSNTGSGNYLEIFYQNVRDLRKKSVEIFNNVCSPNFKMICVTETWLNESFSSQFFLLKFILYIVLLEIAILP
jgi:hypothetical protein